MSRFNNLILALTLCSSLMLAGCASSNPPAATDEAGPSPTSESREERRDTRDVTVPAGGGIEYKLIVEEGDSFEFHWSTSPATTLFYDFHGERRNAPPSDFTSHKAGNAEQDQGSFTAPFSGTHGWYWQNDGSRPITVVVTTSGTYEVKGVISS